MTEQKTVLMEINFRDKRVPVYTEFENVKEGRVVLSGINKKNLGILPFFGLHSSGIIADRNGIEVKYSMLESRIINQEYATYVCNAVKLPLGCQIYVDGDFKPDRKTWIFNEPKEIIFYRLGRAEDLIT